MKEFIGCVETMEDVRVFYLVLIYFLCVVIYVINTFSIIAYLCLIFMCAIFGAMALYIYTQYIKKDKKINEIY